MKIKNWEQVESKLFFPVEEVPLSYAVPGTNQWADIGTHKAIIRTDTNEVLSTVSDNYQLVRNEDVFGQLAEVVPVDNAEITAVWTANNGGRSFVELTIPDQTTEVAVGDLVGNRLIFTNSYDRSKKFSVIAGMVRLVCTNGMVSFDKRTELSTFHLKNQNISGKIDALKQFFEFGIDRVHVYQQYAQLLLEESLREETLKKVVQQTKIPEKYAKMALKLAEEQGAKDLWQIYNNFTEVITHEMESPQRQLQYSRRLDQAVSAIYTELV